jgi:hypothetical protein
MIREIHLYHVAVPSPVCPRCPLHLRLLRLLRTACVISRSPTLSSSSLALKQDSKTIYTVNSTRREGRQTRRIETMEQITGARVTTPAMTETAKSMGNHEMTNPKATTETKQVPEGTRTAEDIEPRGPGSDGGINGGDEGDRNNAVDGKAKAKARIRTKTTRGQTFQQQTPPQSRYLLSNSAPWLRTGDTSRERYSRHSRSRSVNTAEIAGSSGVSTLKQSTPQRSFQPPSRRNMSTTTPSIDISSRCGHTTCACLLPPF